jgi:hypothetical protein
LWVSKSSVGSIVAALFGLLAEPLK